MWSSILFLHCFFAIDPIEDYLRWGFRWSLRCCSSTVLYYGPIEDTSDKTFDLVFDTVPHCFFTMDHHLGWGLRYGGLRWYCSTPSSLSTLLRTSSDEALDVLFHSARLLLSIWSSTLFLQCFLTMGPIKDYRCSLRCCFCIPSLLWTLSKTTLAETFDDTVHLLLLYYGPYQRLPRVRLSMWSSILFLHCFFTMGPIKDYRCGLRY